MRYRPVIAREASAHIEAEAGNWARDALARAPQASRSMRSAYINSRQASKIEAAAAPRAAARSSEPKRTLSHSRAHLGVTAGGADSSYSSGGGSAAACSICFDPREPPAPRASPTPAWRSRPPRPPLRSATGGAVCASRRARAAARAGGRPEGQPGVCSCRARLAAARPPLVELDGSFRTSLSRRCGLCGKSRPESVGRRRAGRVQPPPRPPRRRPRPIG